MAFLKTSSNRSLPTQMKSVLLAVVLVPQLLTPGEAAAHTQSLYL